MQIVLFDLKYKTNALIFEYLCNMELLPLEDIYYLKLTAEVGKIYIPIMVTHVQLAELFGNYIFSEGCGPIDAKLNDQLNLEREVYFREMEDDGRVIVVMEISSKRTPTSSLYLPKNKLLEIICQLHYHAEQRKLTLSK